MNSRHINDWAVVAVGFVMLALPVVLVWWKVLDPQLAQTIIFALTALVVVWYTVETMRLRRDAEARAKRDREPHIYFDVSQPNRIPTNAGERYECRFVFKNDSTNAAFARIRVRLSLAAGPPLLISNAGYDGSQIWEIIPFFELSGFFCLEEFQGFTQFADMVLNVQVDVYGTDHKYITTIKREYRMRLERGFEKFWPEVLTTLPQLPHDQTC